MRFQLLGGLATARVQEAQGDERRRVNVLHRYWDEKRGRNDYPSRADLDPLDFSEIWPNTLLVEVIDQEPPRFRFRVVGTAIVDLYGSDFTGKNLDEVQTGGLEDIVRTGYETAVKTVEPCFQGGVVLYRDNYEIEYRRVVLPLGDPGGKVNMLLVGMFFHWPNCSTEPFFPVRRSSR